MVSDLKKIALGMRKICDFQVLNNYRLRLRFDDGKEGDVDFSAKPRTGVFTFWNDVENFNRAYIGDCGELVWNDQIAFCPDALWLSLQFAN